jgi:hypothetical protein
VDKHTNVQTFLLEACPMKKFFGFLLAVLILYVIYIDLTVGTLPASLIQQVDAKIETKIKQKVNIASFEAKVEPGETVISIVEHQINKPLPVPINDLIADFRKLNPGETPEKIQIGSTYHFPDYSK